MSTEIDLTRKSGMPAEGLHVLKIVRFREDIGDAGPYWMYVLEVQDGIDKGKEMTLILSHSPAARFKVDEFLDAVGAPATGKAKGERYIGKVFRGNIVHALDKSQVMRAGLDKMLPYEGSLPLTPDTSSDSAPVSTSVKVEFEGEDNYEDESEDAPF